MVLSQEIVLTMTMCMVLIVASIRTEMVVLTGKKHLRWMKTMPIRIRIKICGAIKILLLMSTILAMESYLELKGLSS